MRMLMTGICLLALSPANIGDLPNAYSFAMTYNRYGWSGMAIVALVLFLPPRAGPRGDVLEMSIVVTLLVAMFAYAFRNPTLRNADPSPAGEEVGPLSTLERRDEG